jgi:hypothetical protein
MRERLPGSFGDFLRRIAFDYVRYGYHRYVVRTIPDGKELRSIDEKLCRTYGVTSCRTKRMRMRQQGLATIQYLRWRQTFVLLATAGHHKAFHRLKSYDIKESPLHLGSYSIGLRGSVVSIQVAHRVWSQMVREVCRIELEGQKKVEHALASLPFYQFPGVLRQKWKLLQEVNRRRKSAGLPLVFLPPPPKIYYVNAPPKGCRTGQVPTVKGRASRLRMKPSMTV